jgi:quinoprotein dehydrogenase-associated probable ABC transporter substrate-binding protein
MPFSNAMGEGFVTKLAVLIGLKFGATLEYVWFSEGSGYVPNTVGSDACDLVMGYAQGTGLIDDTNPYYYTSYVLLYRADDPSLAGLASLSDPRLKQKRIGLFARTPPASILAMHGLVANAKPLDVLPGESMSKAAEAMVDAVARGELDVALLWGPVAGYFAQNSEQKLKLVPLSKESVGPSTVLGITMGVRPGDPQWKHKINKVIAENREEIAAILQTYGVPLLDPDGYLIKAAAAER